MRTETPLHDFLLAHKGLSCHTPGHKGTLNPLDLTELNGTLELIEQSERNAAELFSAKRTLFSCSGSTLAIFAMLTPFAGKKVRAARNAHRSLIDAAILLDIEIERAVNNHRQNRGGTDGSPLYVTHIDYYGNTVNVGSLADSTPVLVDNAHGAYLVFTDNHPIRQGAAMSADSAHKTLPALTGAAYLHISGTFRCPYYETSASDAMRLFGTTSPSFLILDSLDLCNRHIALEKERALAAFDCVAKLKEQLSDHGYNLRNTDSLRITVNTNEYGYSGGDFAKQLAANGVNAEMNDNKYVILLFSTITDVSDTDRVFAAMRKIPKKTAITNGFDFANMMIVDHSLVPNVNCRKAYFSQKRTIPTAEAVGEVCAGVHVTTPPCVPLIIPGETVSREISETLVQCGLREIDIIAT
jgi:arginine/lysine/ornithine decarboxylase